MKILLKMDSMFVIILYHNLKTNKFILEYLNVIDMKEFKMKLKG
jgi:hypothetical protein